MAGDKSRDRVLVSIMSPSWSYEIFQTKNDIDAVIPYYFNNISICHHSHVVNFQKYDP